MTYLKENLIYHYNWPVQAELKYVGEPSRRSFDPRNGVQVLFLINYFYKSIGLTSANAGKKLEELVYTQIPAEVRSELAVFNWLKGIYLYHSE